MDDPHKRDSAGRFGPGNLANPGGRPKVFREFQDFLEAECWPLAKTAMLEGLRCEDLKTRAIFMKEAHDRLFGKAIQAHAIAGIDGPSTLDGGELQGRIFALLGKSG